MNATTNPFTGLPFTSDADRFVVLQTGSEFAVVDIFQVEPVVVAIAITRDDAVEHAGHLNADAWYNATIERRGTPSNTCNGCGIGIAVGALYCAQCDEELDASAASFEAHTAMIAHDILFAASDEEFAYAYACIFDNYLDTLAAAKADDALLRYARG